MGEQQMHPGTFEIYMRYTGKGGETWVSSHFVWDAPLFVSHRKSDAEMQRIKDGGKYAAEQIMKEQFEASK